MIDYTPAGKSEAGYNLYEENPGGSCANLVCAAARQGTKTTFIGKVGADTQGALLARSMSECGVDISGLIYDPDVFTTLGFVSLDENGERDFSFARKPGADTCLRRTEVQARSWQGAKALHFGALSLNANPTRDTTFEVVDAAREAGILICYDANYRAFLWESENAYRGRSLLAISKCDVLKITDDETLLFTPHKDRVEAAKYLMQYGPRIVCVTLGCEGCFVVSAEGSAHVSAYQVERVVDTTGAGDCFFGSFISQLIKLPAPLQASLVELKDIARYANAAAALCVSRRGGIPAMPAAAEVEALVMKA